MSVRYRTSMAQVGRNTGIPVPPEVLERLGAGKRPPVGVTVNGYSFTSTVGGMGGQALIPFSAERRAASGLAGGDDLDVELTVDEAPRDAPVPEDLTAALAAAEASDAFSRLAPSRRKAHVTNVEGAKTPETRQRRIVAIVASLVE